MSSEHEVLTELYPKLDCKNCGCSTQHRTLGFEIGSGVTRFECAQCFSTQAIRTHGPVKTSQVGPKLEPLDLGQAQSKATSAGYESLVCLAEVLIAAGALLKLVEDGIDSTKRKPTAKELNAACVKLRALIGDA